jgi:oligo-1,6-glucosidase
MAVDREWWQEAVVYQIYAQSFNDSDGDGVGDLPGITAKVDYLDELGVDVVWLTPVYDSPLADNGYDIRDYRSIHGDYGTMEDWERLRDALHARDLRLVMDLVVNHTSDEHEWFERSRRREGKYEDYYYWREEPPNDWESLWGDSAWTYDEERGEYYLHLFDVKQPDLNWRNPDVRADIYEMMRWWLEKGIDGFRMDVINLVGKPDPIPEDPNGPRWGVDQFATHEITHEFIREMDDEVLSEYDVMTVGETPRVSVDDARKFTTEDGLDMVFQFEHMHVDQHPEDPWARTEFDLREFKRIMSRWQTGLGQGWNSVYLGNHDQPRIVSRFGDDGEYRTESAKALATFLLTLGGTPFLYQGDEIGMTNVPFDTLDEHRDVWTHDEIEAALETGQIDSFDEIADQVNYWSRDNARSPMQWTAAENAGFTAGEPWIKVNPNFPEINVAAARGDRDSVLYYYRDLIAVRAEHDAVIYGDYSQIAAENDDVFAYTRTLDGERVLVVIDFVGRAGRFALPDGVEREGLELLVANYGVADPDPTEIDLRPWEARVYHDE